MVRFILLSLLYIALTLGMIWVVARLGGWSMQTVAPWWALALLGSTAAGRSIENAAWRRLAKELDELNQDTRPRVDPRVAACFKQDDAQ